ncbi:hypothetical protein C8R46DRAFT_1119502 [Mycena filopes]|nr:hypothetical protein C8R46DRAFT_1119502 [Mycena filopes]
MPSSPLASQPPLSTLPLDESSPQHPAHVLSQTTEETVHPDPQASTSPLVVSAAINHTAHDARPANSDSSAKAPATYPPALRKSVLQGLAPHLFPTLLRVDPALKHRADSVRARRVALAASRAAAELEIASLERVIDDIVNSLANLEVLWAESRARWSTVQFVEFETEYKKTTEPSRDLLQSLKDRLFELENFTLPDRYGCYVAPDVLQD